MHVHFVDEPEHGAPVEASVQGTPLQQSDAVVHDWP